MSVDEKPRAFASRHCHILLTEWRTREPRAFSDTMPGHDTTTDETEHPWTAIAKPRRLGVNLRRASLCFRMVKSIQARPSHRSRDDPP
jgi:hypothetical protein